MTSVLVAARRASPALSRAEFRAQAYALGILAPPLYTRSYVLDDIVVRSRGDGRTVEAYAAVFDTPAEVKDRHGHYMEVIAPGAFAAAIRRGPDHVSAMFNHAMTEWGTPSELGSVPIGRPLEIRADKRGLFTVTRYNRSALADAVLEAIRNGDIRGQSFRGAILRSDPDRVPARRPGQPLPTIVRHELGLTEYGPTRMPTYEGAAIVAVRKAGSPRTRCLQIRRARLRMDAMALGVLSRGTT